MATAKTDQPLLQNWQEIEYCLDVYRATNGAHTNLHMVWKNIFVALYSGVHLVFVWLLLSYP
jgi:hypothetical protein